MALQSDMVRGLKKLRIDNRTIKKKGVRNDDEPRTTNEWQRGSEQILQEPCC
jgi:hypothetical protein